MPLGSGWRNSWAAASVSRRRESKFSDDAENRENPAETNNLENRSAVGGGGGVVVIAKEQNVIDGRANLSGEASTSPRRMSRPGYSMPVEITRDAAIRRENHHASRVGEEIVLGVKGETEVRALVAASTILSNR